MPMKRRVFNVLALVSLLMALAVAGLWARSVWIGTDSLNYRGNFDQWILSIYSGGIGVTHWAGFETRPREGWWLDSHKAWPTEWKPFNYALGSGIGTTGIRYFYIEVADWVLLLIFSVLPVVWLVIRLRSLKAVGLCATCGYDLRGTAEGRACSECGAAMTPATLNTKACA